MEVTVIILGSAIDIGSILKTIRESVNVKSYDGPDPTNSVIFDTINFPNHDKLTLKLVHVDCDGDDYTDMLPTEYDAILMVPDSDEWAFPSDIKSVCTSLRIKKILHNNESINIFPVILARVGHNLSSATSGNSLHELLSCCTEVCSRYYTDPMMLMAIIIRKVLNLTPTTPLFYPVTVHTVSINVRIIGTDWIDLHRLCNDYLISKYDIERKHIVYVRDYNYILNTKRVGCIKLHINDPDVGVPDVEMILAKRHDTMNMLHGELRDLVSSVRDVHREMILVLRPEDACTDSSCPFECSRIQSIYHENVKKTLGVDRCFPLYDRLSKRSTLLNQVISYVMGNRPVEYVPFTY